MNQSNGPEEGSTVAVYAVAPGIEVLELEVCAPRFVPPVRPGRNVLEIHHCREGRAECRMQDGCLQYISENDLFLGAQRNRGDSVELPLGRYRGIAILVEPDKAAAEAERCLGDIGFCAEALVERFLGQDDCFLIQAREEIARILEGMYAIPREAKGVYFRLKVWELLIYLHYFDVEAEKQRTVYARQRNDIVKQVCRQLTAAPDCRFTIEELARQYSVSPTALKTGFKAVYGASIAAYMKEYRVRQAAALLRDTDKSVAEIAREVGYGSQSKFGAAFRESMQMTPMEYRKSHLPK